MALVASPHGLSGDFFDMGMADLAQFLANIYGTTAKFYLGLSSLKLQEEALKLQKEGAQLAHVEAMETLAIMKHQLEVQQAQTSEGFDLAKYGGVILAGLAVAYMVTSRRR